ncbi:MAG TPA: HRDC domain-containing protein [Acidimicrobiales bacterium]
MHWIDDDRGLAAVVAEVVGVERYAIDTEFHREKTYFPQLALVQLAWADQVALIDPLTADPSHLRPLLEGEGLVVMHAADQDLEVLRHACGAIPRRLFDTQVAAGFVGLHSPSLADLVHRVTGERIPKASRLTDWLRRPLTKAQMDYAAADVIHLDAVWSELVRLLEGAGRLDWACDESEQLRVRRGTPSDPSQAWRRIKEIRSMRGRAANVAHRVATWRETEAARRDEPIRRVMTDMAVVAISQAAPRDLDAMRQIRGVDGRHLRRGVAEALLDAVAAGVDDPIVDRPPDRSRQTERRLRPAVTLVQAWLSQLGRDLRIDPALLATRTDVLEFLSGADGARLATGWRHGLLAEPVQRLIDGDVAVVFRPDGRLALEERSERPITVDLAVPDAEWLHR